MPVFIELVTEALNFNFGDRVKAAQQGAGLTRVRRPLRGLETKEDTYAYLKLIRSDGIEIPLIDTSDPTGKSTSYSNFIIQAIQRQRMERHQLVETFGETYLMLFGQAPKFLNIRAALINSNDFQWKDEFYQNYERYLRGTKSLELGARAYLFYDQNIVEGYILNATTDETADNPMLIPLAFQFFVTNEQSIALLTGDFPIRPSTLVSPIVDITQKLNGEQVGALVRYAGATESGFDQRVITNQPLRSKIADNLDEYTTTPLSEAFDFAGPNFIDKSREVEALNAVMADTLAAYGAEEEDAQDPQTMDDLGVGPTFFPSGVGIGFGGGQSGAGATFGATASATISTGGFTGVKVSGSASAGVGFSAFVGAYASVGVSARVGAFAGVKTRSSTTPGVDTSSFGAAYNKATAFAGVTSRGVGQASAYASAHATARAGAQVESFAYTQAQSAARAGGYTSANSYLGFIGLNNNIGASFAGAGSGAGASVSVGGATTAFSFTSISGILKNVNLPALQALNP